MATRKAIRRTMRDLAEMSDDEFAAFVETAEKIGKGPLTMRNLVKAASTMSRSRRPRGEKPQTTIRILQQTQRQLIQTLADVRTACAEKDKQIASQDAELREAAAVELKTQRLLEHAAGENVRLLEERNELRHRNAFLEGYYAKSTESLPANPQYRAGPRNPENTPSGAPMGEAERQEANAAGAAPGHRDQIRSGEAHGSAHPAQRPMERRPVKPWRPDDPRWAI